MKSIIIVFALIAAATCDVSEIVQGDGWYKDANGYHYNTPAERFDAPVEPELPAPEVPAPAPAPEEPVAEVYVVEEPAPAQDPVVEVISEYLPPQDYLPPKSADELREYLPPVVNDVKRKRQIPGRRQVKQVRKVYRRFVKRH